jgi:hypothetical protein
MLRAATARAARSLAARSRGPTPRAPIHAPPAGVATRALSGKAPSESATRSIAGDNTREYLVKVPAASMEANLDGDQSNLRSRLLTLTSVGVAIYLGFYIFPLVGASPAPSPRARATRSIPSRRPPLTPLVSLTPSSHQAEARRRARCACVNRKTPCFSARASRGSAR